MILEVQRHVGREDGLLWRPGAGEDREERRENEPHPASVRTTEGSTHRDLANRPSGAYSVVGTLEKHTAIGWIHNGPRTPLTPERSPLASRQLVGPILGKLLAVRVRVLPLAIMAKVGDWEEPMKTVAATEAKNRLGAILDQAQREPIVIRRQDRDIAVVLSMADYERLRAGNIQAFLDLRNEVAGEAARRGLTEERLAELLTGDGT
jgi:prevent-host-death family protein